MPRPVGGARVGWVGLLCFVCMAGAAPAAVAAVAPLQWGSVGPRAGGIVGLAPAAGGAGVLWAATERVGIWKSIDGGASWARMPLDLSYAAVVADPVDPLVAYAGGPAGLARTADGGATWQVVNGGSFGALAILPAAPRTLFLATRGDIGHEAAVARSDDGGATWRPLAALPDGAEGVFELDVDPTNPASLFVMGFVFHVDISNFYLHSADGGQTWGSAGATPDGLPVSSLRFDARTPGAVYGLAGGPVRSRDGGATWESADAGLSSGFSDSLNLDPASGALYLTTELLAPPGQPFPGQIWTSADGGASWTKLFERPGPFGPLALDGALPGRLYADTKDAGLLASADGGRSWRAAGIGFLRVPAFDLEPDPQAPGSIDALLVSPLARSAVSSSLPDLARSTDGGATWQSWTPVDASGKPVYLSQLTFDPFVAGTLYSDSGSDLYRSADGGLTWTVQGAYPASFAGASSVVADPHQAGVLYAVGPRSLGGTDVLKSLDRGLTWTQVFSLPSGGSYAAVLLADPQAPGTVYAGGRGGFWRTADGGQTWASLGAGLPADFHSVVRLEIDGSRRLYAQIFPAGEHTLYRSADGGATWAPIDGSLPAGTAVDDLLARGAVLYAATDRGVFASEDGGAHWTAVSDGLVSPAVRRLAAGPEGALLAATDGGLALSPPAPSASCFARDTTLCLGGGRFALAVHWRRGAPNGGAIEGDAHAIPLTDGVGSGSGGFWFFSPESVELVIKMIDGGAVNQHAWVFGGALTDVAYTLTVTDLATGRQRTYENPRGRLASFADTGAFATPAEAAAASPAPSPAALPLRAASRAAGAPCVPAADTLCLAGSRFAVRVAWQLASAQASGTAVPRSSASGTAVPRSLASGTAVPLSEDTGAFWFFDAGNPELVVKILDGRALNGRFWVFLAGLSSVDYTATVTDTATGAAKVYHHASGALASSADTAF